MKKLIVILVFSLLAVAGPSLATESFGNCQLAVESITGDSWPQCEQAISEFTTQAQVKPGEADLKDQIFALLQQISDLNRQLQILQTAE